MIKRFLDLLVSSVLLILFLPVITVAIFLIWIQDFHNPIYAATRVGKNGKLFKMYKLRTMVVNAEKSGIDSTANSDTRITNIGGKIRKYKLDELSQLINVFFGSMSLVGPRPNVKRETDLYSKEEALILSCKPGITDLSSIVFADEGLILEHYKDPDLAYNQVIRPYKSRLAILYVQHQNTLLDLKLLIYTFMNFIDRKKSLNAVHKEVLKITDDIELAQVCLREDALLPKAPPGFDKVIESRDI